MRLAEILWILGIVLSMIALFYIVPTAIALGALVLSTAIFALVWIHIARKNLSKGSSLADFASYLFACMSFFLISYLVQLTADIFELSEVLWLNYISYFSLVIAFLLLTLTSYKLMRIGREFGFAVEIKKIKSLVKKNKEIKEIKTKIKKDKIKLEKSYRK
jgi:hypothetical protein